jgi:ABC-2 type transport system permease protein
VLGVFGTPDWGPIYGGYLGLTLLTSTLVSLGIMISALTSNQIVAAIVTIGISFLMWMIDTLASMMPDALERILISLSLLARFTPFATGAMYTSDFGFFVSTTLLALFLAMRALARR